MAMVIVDLPIKNGWIFHDYVNVYQRVSWKHFSIFFWGRCSRDSNNSCHGGAVQRRGKWRSGPRDFSWDTHGWLENPWTQRRFKKTGKIIERNGDFSIATYFGGYRYHQNDRTVQDSSMVWQDGSRMGFWWNWRKSLDSFCDSRTMMRSLHEWNLVNFPCKKKCNIEILKGVPKQRIRRGVFAPEEKWSKISSKSEGFNWQFGLLKLWFRLIPNYWYPLVMSK